MSEEIFDVVNERDEVIGRAPRREVHARDLLHRAIHVLVFNARGEVFLQKRSLTKDTSPGLWDSSTSGHVDAGEDYDACAVRELREEIGLVVAACPERFMRIAACAETGWEFVWVYQCAERRAVHVASRGDRARGLVCAGARNPLDGGAAGGVCAVRSD